uniref:Uncharacterized protein n=1 Tax=Anguilla anguilla TaxID=7936 RepID=A0A0E9VF04_ANGAN
MGIHIPHKSHGYLHCTMNVQAVFTSVLTRPVMLAIVTFFF